MSTIEKIRSGKVSAEQNEKFKSYVEFWSRIYVVDEKDKIDRKLLELVKVLETHFSTKIEGAHDFSLLESYRVLKEKRRKSVEEKALNNYLRSINFLEKNITRPFGVELILNTHKLLMEDLMKDAGLFRIYKVRVGTYLKPFPDLVPDLTQSWVSQYFGEADLSNLFNLMVISHAEFEYIHPFGDGNGRLGRLLMNWSGKKVGAPPFIPFKKGRYMSAVSKAINGYAEPLGWVILESYKILLKKLRE